MRSPLPFLAALTTAAILSSCSNVQEMLTDSTEVQSDLPAAETLAKDAEDSLSVAVTEDPIEDATPPEAPAPDDLLEVLVSNFTWPTHAENSHVVKEIRWHQKYPEHFYEILDRSQLFLPLITDKLEAQGLPAELALLPFVESGYYPRAFSQSGAAGLWQFIPSTARYLGMHTDWWYDERLDIEVSTDKALEYLSYLNDRFDGNWELTLAAYNGGEGHVASRIKQAGGKDDFWSLKLKNETTAYVPKLLAVVEIISDPEKYGMKLPDIPIENQLVAVELEHQVDLRLAAEKTDLAYEDLKLINAGYLRWISPPTKSNQLLIPQDKESTLLASLSDITSDEQVAWNHYRVQRGDTLIEIAREFGTTLRALVAVNQLKDSRIYINQDLLIPTSELPLTRLASQSNSVKQLYIVKQGDSLWEISRDQGVSISQIRRLNSITRNHISPGQVLVLAETFTGSEITYRVQSGDSLSVIASRFQVAVADIRAWNSLKGDLIKPGQELTIRTKKGS